jgi:hypothetical protein
MQTAPALHERLRTILRRSVSRQWARRTNDMRRLQSLDGAGAPMLGAEFSNALNCRLTSVTFGTPRAPSRALMPSCRSSRYSCLYRWRILPLAVVTCCTLAGVAEVALRR